MNTTQQLQAALRQIVGATVRGACLLIWPSAEGLESADTQLNLSLMLPDGVQMSATLRTSPDGQTPAVELEDAPTVQPYGSLSERIAAWRHVMPSDDQLSRMEAFDISSGSDFPAVMNATVQEVALLCYRASGAPTGIRLAFSSGATLWSVSADDGNRVFARLPEPWFDEEIELQMVV
ncbi:hypothetical protein AAW51_1640 [Caldimonas brevitalea]|uniref:Uncharacterized protein n=1 Tax=Caldimonas brevitalea TaxID=413882 RepID=A0A0G3BLV1_9BURK|nr:hypothetical protein AAW51_1640 [Caldimonas brevitalea]